MEKKLGLLVISAALLAGAPALAKPPKPKPKTSRSGTGGGAKNVYGDHGGGAVSWCAEELETLSNGLCYVKAAEPERRTLVVFLHGMIAKNVDWQWLQERALTRQAKASKFDAIFAKAPLGPGGYAWPGTKEAQDANEDALIAGWNEARAELEKRNGVAYDEVFVMGFSSGAYFTSSLALRGRVKADGFAVFAGGAGFGTGATDMPPVFVGVCADDAQTAGHSRSFGATLAARGWPHRIDEQRVGHMFGDVHVAHAVAWLRAQKKSRQEG